MLRSPFSERFTLFEKGCSGGLLMSGRRPNSDSGEPDLCSNGSVFMGSKEPISVDPSPQIPLQQTTVTAVPVSIDPCVLACGNETIFEGSQIEGALSRRLRHTQGGGSEDLLGVGAYHK